jgi:hypothetical protein
VIGRFESSRRRSDAGRQSKSARRNNRGGEPSGASCVASRRVNRIPCKFLNSGGFRAALFAERLRCRVGRIINLAGRDLGDHDGAGVHVGGALLALGPVGILRSLFQF